MSKNSSASLRVRMAICVLMMAFAMGLNLTGVSPILGTLKETYADHGTTAVQMLQTISWLFLMVGSVSCGWLCTKFGKKTIAIVGLFLVAFFGVIPFFNSSYAVTFISRLFIGFAFGIVNPLNTAIVAELFPLEDRAFFMGFHVIGMGIGNIVGSIFGGFLSGFGYRYFYLVYLITLIGCVGEKFLLEETPITAREKGQHMELGPKIMLLLIATFVFQIAINAFFTNAAIHVANTLGGNSQISGYIMSINAASALLMGCFFAKVSGCFRHFTVPIALAIVACGYVAVIFIPGYAGIILCACLCGAGNAAFSAGNALLLTTAVPVSEVANASGINSVFSGIGGTIAPIILGGISSGLIGENLPSGQFIASGIGLAVLSAVCFVLMPRLFNFNRAEKETN